MNALLNAGDEVLVPAPDYPLWTAAVSLSSGIPRHYLCDENNGWLPDLDDIRAKISLSTRAIVVINPNNPTGALYPDDVLREIVEIARQNSLIIYADEVYDKVLYDGATHTAIGSLSEDVLTVSFNGLSKNYRSCGYRAGWMVVSGDLRRDYIEGLDMLASMRLCANVPGQYGIQTALGGYQSIDDLVVAGRLYRQREVAYDLISSIPGVSCVKPKATLYMFPRLDPKVYPITDDQSFIKELLQEERVLLVQGTGLTGPIRIISGWFFCRMKMICARRSGHRAFLEGVPQASRSHSLTLRIVEVTDADGAVVEADWLSAAGKACIVSCGRICQQIMRPSWRQYLPTERVWR